MAHGIALNLLLCVLLQIWAMIMVGRQRAKTKIDAPATTGHPDLERAIRVQMNHLEQLMIFFPLLWLCNSYFRADVTLIAASTFLVGRVWFALGYYADSKKRGPGFLMSFFSLVALLLCGGFGLFRAMLAG